MSISETHKGNLSIDDYTDEILKNPVKKAIIELLFETGGCFFGDIIEALNFPYEIVLQNLIELKSAGIVSKKTDPSHFVLN